MDLALLRKYLAKADRLLAEHERDCVQLNTLIDLLESRGFSTQLARDLLATYQKQRDEQAQHRDHIREVLERLKYLQ